MNSLHLEGEKSLNDKLIGKPVNIQIVINKDDKFKKHQNVLNQFNSIKITNPTNESAVQNNHVSEIQSNTTDRSITSETFSDSSVSDSQQSISTSRTSFPRPKWTPIFNQYTWSSVHNDKTDYIRSTCTMNRSVSNTDGINTEQNMPNKIYSQSIKHFPRLSTAEIVCERPKSAPVKNALRRSLLCSST
ncbi:unnamed protein product [Schistosoma turkestanicum]|nr:unnamed protein product [Schistosoma turkestanicum]